MNNYLKITLLIFCCFYCITSSAQNISELEKRNGFKDIKLGSHVDSVKGAFFKKDFIELKEFEANLYEVNNPAYEKIGEAEVRNVQLKTYKGLIYEIVVTTPVDPKIMAGLEKLYGKAHFSLRYESYNWSAPEKITLAYKGNKKEVTLTYRSIPIIKMMYFDKNKKIEAVAQDF